MALVPLKLTTVAPVRFVPVIVKVAPTGPLAGEKVVIVGVGVAARVLIVTS